jgi:hypothetical protein
MGCPFEKATTDERDKRDADKAECEYLEKHPSPFHNVEVAKLGTVVPQELYALLTDKKCTPLRHLQNA